MRLGELPQITPVPPWQGWAEFVANPAGGGGPPPANVILLEDGTDLLLEDGSNFLIE